MGKVKCCRYPKEKCKHCEEKRFKICESCRHNLYQTIDVWSAVPKDHFEKA